MKKLMMIATMVLLGACSKNVADNDHMDGSFDQNANSGINSSVIPGSANDPASPAYFQQTIGDRVHFEVDQHQLTPMARSILDSQADWINSNSGYNVMIEGHADEQGTREYNIALGNRRADAARNYLLSRGVPGSRMQIVSFGKERPLEVCSQEQCYSKNRRAVTVLASGISG